MGNVANHDFWVKENNMRISVNRDKLLKHAGMAFTKFMFKMLVWGIIIGAILTITIGTAIGTVAILMKGNV